MLSPRHLLPLLAVTGAAALAPTASATTPPTICVHAPAGTPCDSVQPDLQAALDAAEATLGPDVIEFAQNGAPIDGPFVYPHSKVDASNTVTIKGVGPSKPILKAPAGATVLSLGNGSLENVAVELASAASGRGIEAGGATLRGVDVTGPGDAFGAEGIRTDGDLTLENVTVKGTGGTGLQVLSGGVAASGLRVSGVAHGVGVNDFAQVEVTDSKIAGRDRALGSRGIASASRTVLETTGPDGSGVFTGDGTMTLDHVSVVHRGAADSTGAAFDVHPVEGGGHGNLSAVVFAGYAHGLHYDTSECCSFPLVVRDSVWDNTHDFFLETEDAATIDEFGDAHEDPRLADLANGDFRPRGSSAAIDRETRNLVRYHDVDGIDVVDGDGNGDAIPDAGAFEYRRRAPSIGATDVPASGTTGQAIGVTAAATDLDGDAVQFAWDFGDGQIGSGAQAQHVYAAPGIYTVTLRVTDEAGLAATRTFSIAVSGADAGAPGTTGSSGSAGVAKDLVAPKLTKVRLSKNHRKLLFTLSERAKVRVTVHGRTIVKTVAAGRRSIRLTRVRRGVVKVTATDAAGNRSSLRTLRVRP